jgi:hypothetical protein
MFGLIGAIHAAEGNRDVLVEILLVRRVASCLTWNSQRTCCN